MTVLVRGQLVGGRARALAGGFRDAGARAWACALRFTRPERCRVARFGGGPLRILRPTPSGVTPRNGAGTWESVAPRPWDTRSPARCDPLLSCRAAKRLVGKSWRNATGSSPPSRRPSTPRAAGGPSCRWPGCSGCGPCRSRGQPRTSRPGRGRRSEFRRFRFGCEWPRPRLSPCRRMRSSAESPRPG
jgi:hypothetical protein